MQTECNADLFEFAPVGCREVVGSFDGGAITSDAGALLLRETDRAIGLNKRFAACFDDRRCQELVEHSVETLVGQRVLGIALGYEDINDHDELRHRDTRRRAPRHRHSEALVGVRAQSSIFPELNSTPRVNFWTGQMIARWLSKTLLIKASE
jgi:hypothetical protein